MDIMLRIRSFFEGKGTAEAADGIDRVGKAAGKTAPALGQSRESAEKAFGAINAATQVTEGGLNGLGQTVKNLGSQFPGLSAAALGPIGLVIAAVAAWRAVVVSVLEAHDKLEATIRMIKIGNLAAQIKTESEAFDALYTSIRRAGEERQRWADIEQSKDDAVMRAELAKLGLDTAQRTAGLSPDDEIGRSKINLDAATKRAELEEAASKRKSEREERSLKAQEFAQYQTIKAAENEMASAEEHFSTLLSQRMSAIKRTREKSDRWLSLPNQFETASPDMDQLAKLSQEQFEKRGAASNTKYAAEQALIEIRAKREVSAIDAGTRGTSSQTRQTTEWAQERDIVSAENKAVDAELAQFSAKLDGAPRAVHAAFQAMITSAEKNGELSVSWMKALTASNQKLMQEVEDMRNANRLRQ